jgi:hypothetical protein
MKIANLIESYDSLVKQAFIPNPQPQQDAQQLQAAYGQLQQTLQSLPPEAQQQIAPMLQQLQQLPPDQQLQQIGALLQQLQGQAQGGQPQQDAAQAQGQPQQDPSQAPQEEGHQNAENSLDNTKVTLSVRELLDLSSGGKATQSLLKVKQMADAHNKKMEATQQQQEQAQAQAQQEQAQQAQAQQGGIYSAPMGGAAPGGQ